MQEAFWRWLSRRTDFDPMERVIAKMDAPDYDVFLGGSCGDTSWRQDEMIPNLNSCDISFYNPQKKHGQWCPRMISEEERAKSSSKLLLFVVHKSAVSVVSLLEISYFAAQKTSMVVVLPENDEFERIATCNEDVDDRVRALDFLRMVLRKHHVPHFSSCAEAWEYMEDYFMREKFFCQAVRERRLRWRYLSNRFWDLWRQVSTFVSIVTSSFTPSSVYGGIVDEMSRLRRRPRNFSDAMRLFMVFAELFFLFTLVFNGEHLSLNILLVTLLLFCHLFACNILPRKMVEEMRRHRVEVKFRRTRNCFKPVHYDVFLANSGGDFRSEWISKKAVPAFHKAGLSYMDGTFCRTAEQRLLVMAQCSHLVYVISSPCRFLSGLLEIAYCLGSTRNVVACVPTEYSVLERCTNASNDLSSPGLQTRNDGYKRGMAYLHDMAKRKDAIITEDVHSAIQHVLLKATTE